MSSWSNFKSASQRARIFSEEWIAQHFHCPVCAGAVEKTPNNTAAKDFVCPRCGDPFEVKSRKGVFGSIIPNGAYDSMLASIRSAQRPNLVLMSYTPDYQVKELTAIPSRFLVEQIVLPRKPLGAHCRRAGWRGCNLNIGMLPPEGRIPYVRGFRQLPFNEINRAWTASDFLDDVRAISRGWLALTMGLVHKLGRSQFSLEELYKLESVAAQIFPKNANVRAKLQQQLQRLRDLGWLEFEGKGRYRVLGGRELQ